MDDHSLIFLPRFLIFMSKKDLKWFTSPPPYASQKGSLSKNQQMTAAVGWKGAL